MHMTDSAAHWYQSFKLLNPYHDWELFKASVLAEFEVNTHHNKLMELLSIHQTGPVEEYKKQFEQLMYHVKLYDNRLSEPLLVAQFILGLKDELRALVEVKVPDTVSKAAQLAVLHEAVIERQKKFSYKPQSSKWHGAGHKDSKQDHKAQFQPGELWKAKQLHAYRKANDLCYKCGDKYIQGHKCAIDAQANAIQVEPASEILSDEVLDVIVANAMTEEDEMHLSLNAIAGTASPRTIRVRALVKNQVLIMLLDTGSSHSFVDKSLADRIGCSQSLIRPRKVKVASGNFIQCNSEIKNFTWWVPNSTFQHDMKVLQLGGYDVILGMDWLEQRGLMNCQFAEKCVEFQYENKIVRLQGILDKIGDNIAEVSVDQLMKWERGK
ncbi:hypothetical protein QOZ80_3AG0245520 [Eleusine coracana subsp. coracana]|nr:hypothetical protein QOZ80_3AG0245520 [Eleusine coracana subsp. coracana]